MHIGHTIKNAMKARGVSTSDMAAHCEVTKGAVSNWFATGRVSKENLVKVAHKLDIGVEELISGEAGERGAVAAPEVVDEASLAVDTLTLLQAFNRLGNKNRAAVIAFAVEQASVGLTDSTARSKPRAFKDEGALSARKTSGLSAAGKRKDQK